MKTLLFLLTGLLCCGSDFQVYFGDSNPYRTAAMTTDAAGNTYLTGGRVFGNLLDVFVTKLDSTGHVVFTSTTGGKGSDTATSIAVDANGNIWVAGSTTSPDFPLLDSLQKQAWPSGNTGFVIKLAADGTIVFSTYFGGALGPSAVNGIAVDSSGNAYLTGITGSREFPVTPGMPATPIGTGLPRVSGAFISKISASGTLVYSGVISGNAVICQAGSSCFLSDRTTYGAAIAVDSSGNAYVTGNTDTTDMPATPGAFLKSGLGAFVMKVNAAGSGLAYLTYLGGTLPDYLGLPEPGYTIASAIAIDQAGDAYVTGATGDPNFAATANAYQKTLAGALPPNSVSESPTDAFAAKISPDGMTLDWATFLGGSGIDAAKSIALDPKGNVWLSGTTQSADFPNASGWSAGGDFLVSLNSSGSALNSSTRYPNNMVSTAIGFDGGGSIHAAGLDGLASSFASSAPQPSTIVGISNAAIGDLTGRIVPGEVISIYGPHIGPATPAAFTGVNGFVPAMLAGVQVTIGGHPAPLLYVSDWQINAIVPVETAGSTTADIQITFSGQQSASFTTVISPGEPGIFSNGGVAIFNQDGTPNSQSNPAAVGSIVSIWATGLDLSGYITDGEIATAAQFGAQPQLEALVGGQSSEITYAGASPGIVEGVVQINVKAIDEITSNGIALSIGGWVSPVIPFYEN